MSLSSQGMVIRGRTVGLLDIGSTKVACLIAAPQPKASARAAAPGRHRILALAQHAARGLRAGVVTDLEEAEHSVRAAVAEAERQAGVVLDEVAVAIACGRLKSSVFTANADVETGVVTDGDISRLMGGARAYAERDGRSLVHLNRIALRVDGAQGGADPRGMAAGRISAAVHAVTADEPPIRNLLAVVERTRLTPAALALAPYTSALVATTAEERRIGVTCLDIGGGTAKLATFAEGELVNVEVVPVGGNHITYDIARALQTPLAEAERIKALYGTLAVAPSDAHELVSYPLAGEEEGASSETTRAELAAVIRDRMSALAGLVSERLQRSGVLAFAGDRIVLTGGVSRLPGIAGFVAGVMGCPVRVAPPQPLAGWPEGECGPAFSTLAGLLLAVEQGSGVMTLRRRETRAAGYLGRVGAWIREGF